MRVQQKAASSSSKSGFLPPRRHQLREEKRVSWLNKALCAVIYLNMVSAELCNLTEIGKQGDDSKYANESSSAAEARALFEDTSGLVWSQFLEDYVLSQSSSVRTAKELPFASVVESSEMITTPGADHQLNSNSFSASQNPKIPFHYHPSSHKRYIPTSNAGVYDTRRVGEDVELQPHMRPPIQVVNPQFRPMTNQMIQQQQQPGLLQSLFGFGSASSGSPTPQQARPLPAQQHPAVLGGGSVGGGGGTQAFRAVTENDLYLLGAIEKLVYRVDYLESRIRRAEQLIYYLMAGNHQKEVRDPCPHNFTRISENCYHISSQAQANWKTANSACKALGAHLAEFEKGSENEEIIAYLLNHPNHRGSSFWVGGLNPGLLWIWSNSAKPVNPNMNLTSIALAQQAEGGIAANATLDSEQNRDVNQNTTSNETILKNTFEIKGQGRCLRLSYNPAKHSYTYHGQECTSRHHYICEYEDRTLDNKIKKIARSLGFSELG